DCFSIGRPTRRVHKVLPVCDPNPRSAGSCRYIECGFQPLGLSSGCFKDNPAAIKGEVTLVEIVVRVGNDPPRRALRMRPRSHWQLPDLSPAGVVVIL